MPKVLNLYATWHKFTIEINIYFKHTDVFPSCNTLILAYYVISFHSLQYAKHVDVLWTTSLQFIICDTWCRSSWVLTCYMKHVSFLLMYKKCLTYRLRGNSDSIFITFTIIFQDIFSESSWFTLVFGSLQILFVYLIFNNFVPIPPMQSRIENDLWLF